MFDVFSGSSIVARYFKQFSELLIVNDLEKYSTVINECYLSNYNERSEFSLRKYYYEIIGQAKSHLVTGVISELYAPKDDTHIKQNERVFYTTRNAMYIDTVRQLIDNVPEKYQKYFLALCCQKHQYMQILPVFSKGFIRIKKPALGNLAVKTRTRYSE